MIAEEFSLKHRVAELQAEIDRLNRDIEVKAKLLTKQSAEIDFLRAEVENLNATALKQFNAHLTECNRMYDEIERLRARPARQGGEMSQPKTTIDLPFSPEDVRMGRHLGNAIAGYRDGDFKRSAEGMVEAVRAFQAAVAEIDLLRAEVARQWQPIKTVLKDGTAVLIATDTMQWVAYWDEDSHPFCWHVEDAGKGFNLNADLPTHWMPLPAPPGKEK